MVQDEMDPELQQLIEKTRVQKPSDEFMRNYKSEVNTKINQALKSPPSNGFPLLLAAFILILAIAGWFYGSRQMKTVTPVPPTPILKEVAPVKPSIPETPASDVEALESEIAFLESFDSELATNPDLLYGEDSLLQDLDLLEEMEFSSAIGIQPDPRLSH